MSELSNLLKDVLGIKKNETNKNLPKKEIFHLPIKKLGDIFLGEDNFYKTILKITPVNASLLDIDDLENVASCIQGALSTQEGRIQILIQSESVNLEKNIKNIEDFQKTLNSELKLEELEKDKNFLISLAHNKISNVLNFYVVLETNEKDQVLAEQILNDKFRTIKTELEELEMFTDKLNQQEITKLLFEKLNPVSSQFETIQDYYTLDNIMPENTLSYSDGIHLEVEKYIYRHFAISNYPATVDKYRWFRKILEFKGNFTISFILTPKNKATIQKELSKATEESVTKMNMAEKDISKKLQYEQEAQSAIDMIRELGSDTVSLYNVNVTLQLGATDQKELQKLVNSMRAKVSSSYMQLTELRFKEYFPFHCCLPILPNNVLTQKYVWNLSSADIASIIPFDSAEFMESKGTLIGENVKSNGLVIVDRYNKIYNNPHLCIIAESGSGKSFWLSTDIKRSLPYMDYIIQFDVDGTASFPWAKKYKFDGISGIITNPFHIRNATMSKDKEIEVNVGRFLLVKVMDLITFFKWIFKDMTAFDEAILEEDIRDTYEKFGLNKNSTELPKEFPTMSTLNEVFTEKINNSSDVNSEEIIRSRKNMKAILKPYIDGVYSSLFNGQTNWDYDLHTILDVSSLPEAVQPPLYELLLKDTWQFCKKDGVLQNMTTKILKKVIIDECHRFADEKNPQTLNFISTELLKQSRKFGINVVTATQGICDLTIIKKYGQAILDNSYFKIFFKLGETDHEIAKKLYRLSSEEMKIIRGSGSRSKGSKGKGIFMAGGQRVIFQGFASKYELEYIDPAQYEEIYKEKSRYA